MANLSFLLPLTAGTLIAIQIPIETKIRISHGVLPVAFFAFALASIACLIWAWWAGENPVPNFKELQFSQFFGGPARIAYLILMTAPAISMGNSDKMCLVVVGQILVGSLIEHFGLFGTKQIKLDWQSVLGITGLMVSLFLILKRPCS